MTDNKKVDNKEVDIKNDVLDEIKKISNNFSEIIPIDKIINHPILKYGRNGMGDRWCRKMFIYSVIYKNGIYKSYLNTDDVFIPELVLSNFVKSVNNKNRNGIIGIYIHSINNKIQKISINSKIKKEISKNSCVVCGSNSNICCDHKNDLYNNPRILNIKTQQLNDFQPLCNHCNLQKREVCKKEKKIHKLYSGNNIPMIKKFNLHKIPWELKNYDILDVNLKEDTFWYDPVEFINKLIIYTKYVVPILMDIKNLRNKL